MSIDLILIAIKYIFIYSEIIALQYNLTSILHLQMTILGTIPNI